MKTGLLTLSLLSAAALHAGSIESAVAAVRGAGWVGYEFASVSTMNNGNCRSADKRGIVLIGVADGRVQKVRVSSPGCDDEEARPVTWLKNVGTHESIAYLRGLTVKGAVAAIALHDSGEADAALEVFLKPDASLELRKDAVFWLGAARGAAGERRLERVLAEDSSVKVREQAVFALSISKEPAALSRLIRASKEDRDPEVRGKALFWMAQKAGKKTAAALGEAVERDPETKVKRQAVFALSQLPDGEGVPELIRVARTNRSAEVRKQAFFWLGQSKDPRAAGFLEEVLTR
jgi:hypothetical protein